MLLAGPVCYGRFGFRRDTPLRPPGPLTSNFQVLPFMEDVRSAQVSFAPTFSRPGRCEQGPNGWMISAAGCPWNRAD